MKKITSIFLIGFLTTQGFANNAEIEDYLLEDVAIFTTELELPAIIPHSPVWTEPLFY